MVKKLRSRNCLKRSLFKFKLNIENIHRTFKRFLTIPDSFFFYTLETDSWRRIITILNTIKKKKKKKNSW